MRPSLPSRTAVWLALAGLPGYVFCFVAHVCIAGHWRHPPYGWWHLASDALWVALFAGAALLAWRRKLPGRGRLAVLVAVLALSRLALGSGGGLLMVLVELPAVLYLVVVAVRKPRARRVEAPTGTASTSPAR